jgi:peroxiredoxin
MQLVELQESLDPSVAVVAISYDPVSTLSGFAAEHSIAYPLLSDVGSRTIERLGLLNTEVDADNQFWGFERKPRHDGLPFPATFVLDSSGVIVDRRFERSHRNRPTTRLVLEESGLALPDRAAQLSVEASGPAMSMVVSVPRASFFPNQVFPVDIDLGILPGMHVYVPPTPAGYTALEVAVDGPDGVYWEAPDLPTGHDFEIPALGERFSVIDGAVHLRVPVHIHESTGDATLVVSVTYQACDDAACLLPARLTLELPLQARPKM